MTNALREVLEETGARQEIVDVSVISQVIPLLPASSSSRLC